MKAGTPKHPKMLELASALKIAPEHAAGIMEVLWHWVARYAPAGDVGKHSDEVICQEVAPSQRGKLIEALVKVRWLDREDWSGKAPGCFGQVAAGWPRLWVHDWHEHCEDRVRKHLKRNGLLFANGKPPRGADGEPESRQCLDMEPENAGQGRARVRLHARAPEPEPMPEPEPVPAGGRPRGDVPGSFREWIVVMRAVPGYEKIKEGAAERIWGDVAGLMKALPREVVEKAWKEFLDKAWERSEPWDTPCSTWRVFLERAAPREGAAGGGFRPPAPLGVTEAAGMSVAADVDEGDAEARRRAREKKSDQ